MTYTVTFLGTSSLPVTSSGGAYRIWSYKVDGSNTEIVTGRRMTMAFPGSVTVVDPSAYPSVDALNGTLVWRSPDGTRQYVAARASAAGSVTIAFVAAAQTSSGQVQLFKATPGNDLVEVQFEAVPDGGGASHSQRLVVPAAGAPAFTGRPLYDFAGALPYDSELFGVYQPLSGWVGATAGMSAKPIHPSSDIGNLQRENFHGSDALTLIQPGLKALTDRYSAGAGGALSPVGLVNLFREYFFEFDNFLGTPSGHIWVSPGGTVEVVESSTRRTLVEKVVEQSEEVSRKSEESLTDQTDVSDAVKEENSNDTKLGVSATGGVNAKIYHADASLSFSTQNTVKRGAETTHKRARTQTSKVTSEIKRNFKTTFRTVTETTDTSSRRYVLQNTTSELVNYEMRRKMRKVGIQLQHVGTRLCWQIHLLDPGRELGMGDMVHVVPAPDLSAIQKPEKLPPPEDKQIPFHFDIAFLHDKGTDDEAEETYLPVDGNPCRGIHVNNTPLTENDTIDFCNKEPIPLPAVPAGYKFSEIVSSDKHGAQLEFASIQVDAAKNTLSWRLTYANFQTRKSLPIDVVLRYVPTEEEKKKVKELNDAAQAEYQKEVDRLQHEAYGQAVRERLRLISSMRLRSSEDLRNEERRSVFRKLIKQLPEGIYPTPNNHTPYLAAEEIQKFFDVDEMLYFVSPDFWRAGAVNAPMPDAQSTGRYPVRAIPKTEPGKTLEPLAGQTVAGWYSGSDFYALPNSTSSSPPYEWRVNYLISEETVPAPLGSSLGWLIQIDADERRNEFLNAAWAKAVLPVRPGQEQAALAWLKKVEGEAGLGKTYTRKADDPDDYQGTVGQVLDLLATHLRSLAQEKFNTTLAADKVFENGFDPLAGGFRPAEPYQVFDQWVEVLPTDQVVACSVKYDPKTGQQL
ncbi:hypothetical protein [Streptomyces bottropensis]|uniref:hypothetical protein n=1 Tax=Streptomyces bottropensis TaxID=42235 RepID=UPI00369F70E9